MLKAAAADRNKYAILEVLQNALGREKNLKVLEIASGPGQHVTYFAQAMPNIIWQPTELTEPLLSSIQSYVASANLKSANVKMPVIVDVTKPVDTWPKEVSEPGTWDAILCVNMMHIASWNATQGLFSASSSLLNPSGGRLITYGPYAVDGLLTPSSNEAFDKRLREENPEWGIRDVAELKELCKLNKMELTASFEMPANNKILIFSKL